MPVITKKFIKEAVLEAVEPLAKSVQKDFHQVNQRLDILENKFTDLLTKLDEILTLFKKLDEENTFLSVQLRRLEDRVARLESQYRK